MRSMTAEPSFLLRQGTRGLNQLRARSKEASVRIARGRIIPSRTAPRLQRTSEARITIGRTLAPGACRRRTRSGIMIWQFLIMASGRLRRLEQSCSRIRPLLGRNLHPFRRRRNLRRNLRRLERQVERSRQRSRLPSRQVLRQVLLRQKRVPIKLALRAPTRINARVRRLQGSVLTSTLTPNGSS